MQRASVSKAPPRAMQSDPPMVHLGGYDRDCQDCHRIFKFEAPGHRALMQHTEIQMRHGINQRCLGCHDQNDRNRLTIGPNETVAFADSARLCGKCHGPTYRDWQRGTHGRASGSWVIGSPERKTLTCVQCHDPHRPAYDPMAPLPAPKTLRMGPQDPYMGHRDKNPLMRHLPKGGH